MLQQWTTVSPRGRGCQALRPGRSESGSLTGQAALAAHLAREGQGRLLDVALDRQRELRTGAGAQVHQGAAVVNGGRRAAGGDRADAALTVGAGPAAPGCAAAPDPGSRGVRSTASAPSSPGPIRVTSDPTCRKCPRARAQGRSSGRGCAPARLGDRVIRCRSSSAQRSGAIGSLTVIKRKRH